jgi:hypothetical protein
VDSDRAEIAARAQKISGSVAVFGAAALREGLKGFETAAKASAHD